MEFLNVSSCVWFNWVSSSGESSPFASRKYWMRGLTWVRNYESRAHEFGFDAQSSVFTGLGLGFLAATAIVASPSLLDLPITAAEVIRIAMRAGILLYQKSQDLEPQPLDGPLESWTTVVRGLEEKTVRGELEMFNMSTVGSLISMRCIERTGI